MKRNKLLPGTRPFFFFSAIMGVFRAADELGSEVGAPAEPINPETRVSGDDLDPKLLWKIGVGLLLVIWAITVVIYPFFHFLMYDRTGGIDPAKVLAYIPKLPPKPRNEHAPFLTLEKFQKREEGDLNSYRWVDREKGIVSIPIARAMEIIARHGIPPPPESNVFFRPPRAVDLSTGFQGKVVSEAR